MTKPAAFEDQGVKINDSLLSIVFNSNVKRSFPGYRWETHAIPSDGGVIMIAKDFPALLGSNKKLIEKSGISITIQNTKGALRVMIGPSKSGYQAIASQSFNTKGKDRKSVEDGLDVIGKWIVSTIRDELARGLTV